LKKLVANKNDLITDVEPFDFFLTKKLNERFERGLQRKLTTHSGKTDFTSNDYLGLARSIQLFNLIHQRVLEAGTRNGSTGSRLLSGNNTYTESVESRLAEIFECESTLLFNSGYAANMALLSSLPQKDDTIIYDELAHACIKDGARLSLAKRFSFRHNNIEDLMARIRHATGRIYVVVESIYSMDGDECCIDELIALKARHPNIILMVDEAHSTGVMGNRGSGFVTAKGLADSIDIRVHTFGKAMGSHGACVAGSRMLRDYLINFARPFIYTTAPPVHSVAAIECGFEFLAENIGLQQQLQNVILLYAEHTSSIKSRTLSRSAIQTIIIPGNERVRLASADLQAAGFDVRPILSPTVPKGLERLRICLHSYNTADEIIQLSSQLKNILRSNNLQ
jgi:8-amino-7-oxononanoate synthase